MSIGLEFLYVVCDQQLPAELRRFDQDFYVGDDEQACYEYCVAHLRRHGRLPTVETLQDETRVELPAAEDAVSYYVDAVMDRRLYNEIRDPYQQLRQALSEQNMSGARNAIGALVTATRRQQDAIDVFSASDAFDLVTDRYNANHRIDGLVGVPSGWAGIDDESFGWQAGDLIAWVARMGMGKTWTLLYQLGSGIRAGAVSLFATMEMPVAAVASRFYAMESGVDPRQLRRGRLTTYDERRFLAQRERWRNDDRLHWFNANMGQGIPGLEALISEIRPDIVYIDGVYLMRSFRTRRGAQRNEIVTDVLDDLKEIALRRNIPIVLTSQFNRESRGRGRGGSLETIGYSDAFGTHCSNVYAIKPPHARNQDQNVRVYETLKGREGEEGVIAVNFKFSPFSMAQIPLATVMRAGQDDHGGDRQPANMDWMRNG